MVFLTFLTSYIPCVALKIQNYDRKRLVHQWTRTSVGSSNSKNELLKNQLTIFFPDITFNHKLQDQVSALKMLSLN